MQNWLDVISPVTTLASIIAAILAWVAKIRWSKEYASAKDEIIRAKEAHIAVLESEIASLKELNPVRLRELHKSVTEELEEFNDRLQKQVAIAESEIAIRDIKIQELEESGGKRQDELLRLRDENQKLFAHVETLKEKETEVRLLQENPISYWWLDANEITDSLKEVISSTDSIKQFLADKKFLEEFQSDNRVFLKFAASATKISTEIFMGKHPSSDKKPLPDDIIEGDIKELPADLPIPNENEKPSD